MRIRLFFLMTAIACLGGRLFFHPTNGISQWDNPAWAGDDDGGGVDWDKYDEDDDDDDDDDDPDPIQFDGRLDWIRAHLRGEEGRRIQRQIACMESGYLNTPVLVPDLIELIKEYDQEPDTRRIALFNLARMDEMTLMAGGGLDLVDKLLARYNDIAKGDDYAKEQLGAIFYKISGKWRTSFRNDFGVLNNHWKDKDLRKSYDAFCKKKMEEFKKQQETVSANSAPRNYEENNPYTKVYYYGRHPIDLVIYVDVAPVQQGTAWDIQINRELINLTDLLLALTPKLRVGLVTFADKDEAHLSLTSQIMSAKEIMAGLGYTVQRAVTPATGFLLSLDWTDRNTAWSRNGRRVGLVVSDQDSDAGGLRDTLHEYLKAMQFASFHAAGHYAITQEPEPAPDFYKAAAKATGGRATYAREMDLLAGDIAPLAWTDDEEALKEMRTFFNEILKHWRSIKKDDLPFGYQGK